MSILALEIVGYTYDGVSPVLKDIDYTFEKVKLYAIVGPSGAGKTTLLSLLSGLTTASEGEVLFNGKNIQKINRYDYRSQDVGVVFQQFWKGRDGGNDSGEEQGDGVHGFLLG